MSIFAPKPGFSVLTSGGSSATQPSQTSNNIFGTSQQPYNNSISQFNQNSIQTGSLFGGGLNQSQQQGLGLGNSAPSQPFGPSTLTATYHQAGSQSAQQQPLWQPGSSLGPREKTVPEQMQILLEKWSPDSSSCAFQRYFYNNVDPHSIPFYGPSPGEDEHKWEEALSNKPGENSIPVLCRGFATLGNRLHVQVQSVTALQARLHEINNSLSEILQRHNGQISVRAMDARRRHIALSQRCLQLATKIQILRNRGYAMDGSEEELKRKLSDLEKDVFDPQLNSRQDEIWARMVAVRERIDFLQEQSEKVKIASDSQNDGLDEHILRTTRKILDDYDTQIIYLQHEVSAIRDDYEEWEKARAIGNSTIRR